MDWSLMEPSTANFNAFASSCGHCSMYSLCHQAGIAIITQFFRSDGNMYTSNMSLLPAFKRRTCFLQASRLRCISPPLCVASWVIKFLCGEIRQPPEGFMSMLLCRLCICSFCYLSELCRRGLRACGGLFLFSGFRTMYPWNQGFESVGLHK